MHIHSGAENNFTRNVGGFRHLYDLTKDQLFNHFGGDLAACQQFAYHHLP